MDRQTTDNTLNASPGGSLLVEIPLPQGAAGPQTEPQNCKQHGVAGPDLGRTTRKNWTILTNMKQKLKRKNKQTNLNTTEQQRGFMSTLAERTSVCSLPASCEVVRVKAGSLSELPFLACASCWWPTLLPAATFTTAGGDALEVGGRCALAADRSRIPTETTSSACMQDSTVCKLSPVITVSAVAGGGER